MNNILSEQEILVERKDEPTCHCDDHGELRSNTSSLCRSMDKVNNRLDQCLPRTAFQWLFGIMIAVLIVVLGYLGTSMAEIQKNVASIDKNMAVMKSEITGLKDSAKRNEHYGSTLNRN